MGRVKRVKASGNGSQFRDGLLASVLLARTGRFVVGRCCRCPAGGGLVPLVRCLERKLLQTFRQNTGGALFGSGNLFPGKAGFQ
jgi:hypothetical protein